MHIHIFTDIHICTHRLAIVAVEVEIISLAEETGLDYNVIYI